MIKKRDLEKQVDFMKAFIVDQGVDRLGCPKFAGFGNRENCKASAQSDCWLCWHTALDNKLKEIIK